MKHLFSILFLVFSLSLMSQEQSVLFLGNSYTYFNDLPKLVSDIASSKSDSLFYDSNTPGGYTLQGHSTNSVSKSKITSRKWDYVVLQEQSQRPSFPPSQVQSDVFPYAEFLDSLIRDNDSCTETMFYMTWGRKYGDQSNCASYPPLCTYQGMQTRLRDSYVQMANDNDAVVSPVGIAFRNSIAADSNLNLYTADNSHPSIYGSYLAACVFYSSIFHKSSVGGYHPSSVSGATAFFLQNIADITVFDSLSTWRIDTNTNIIPDFIFSLNGMSVQFTDQSSVTNADHHWAFGDGNFSSDKDPLHTYTTHGNYNVEHTVTKNCESESVNKLVDIIGSGIINQNDDESILISPNPSNGTFRVKFKEGNEILKLSVFDSSGRHLNEFYQKDLENEISLKSKGLHLLIFEVANGELLQKRLLIH